MFPYLVLRIKKISSPHLNSHTHKKKKLDFMIKNVPLCIKKYISPFISWGHPVNLMHAGTPLWHKRIYVCTFRHSKSACILKHFTKLVHLCTINYHVIISRQSIPKPQYWTQEMMTISYHSITYIWPRTYRFVQHIFTKKTPTLIKFPVNMGHTAHHTIMRKSWIFVINRCQWNN